MSYPGVIERPLLADEFSIYLDNSRPIPLSALATLLAKIDKEARAVRGMDGLFLELSDFALGSNELRCRVVGPGRLALREAEIQERTLAATEGSARASKVAAGAGVVSAVAAVVAIGISVGNANPATYKIVNQYNVCNVYIRAPDEPPHVITREEIEHGRYTRLSDKRKLPRRGDVENQALLTAMEHRQVVDLAGWFREDSGNNYIFETMHGNRFPVHFRHARDYRDIPVALRTIVQDSPVGIQLEVIDVIAELSVY
jgi:hypothetical protein